MAFLEILTFDKLLQAPNAKMLDIETYEKHVGRFELSTFLDQGLEDAKKRIINMQMNSLMN